MGGTRRIGSRFIMQAGVTGRAGPDSPPPLDTSLLDRAAASFGYWPDPVRPPASYRRYRKPGAGLSPAYLLMHRLLPLVAFAVSDPPGFADDPDSDRFGPRLDPLRLLTAAVLDAPLRPEAPHVLPPAERAHILLHAPKTVGQLVFNRWP